MSIPPFNVGNYLEDRLEELEIKNIFGVSGPNMKNWFEILRKSEFLELITMPTEKEVMNASDAFFKLNGGIACVSVNFGPSCLKILNYLSGSLFAKIPLLIVCVTPSVKRLKDSSYVDLFKKLTRKSVHIDSSYLAPTLIDELLIECISFQSPVYLEIPEDLFLEKCKEPHGLIEERRNKSNIMKLLQTIQKIKEIYPKFKFPIIMAGREINQLNLNDLFFSFLKKYNFSYVTTLSSKGFLSEKNDYLLGTTWVKVLPHSSEI
jgi:indolepyruvate decarboxylase